MLRAELLPPANLSAARVGAGRAIPAHRLLLAIVPAVVAVQQLLTTGPADHPAWVVAIEVGAVAGWLGCGLRWVRRGR